MAKPTQQWVLLNIDGVPLDPADAQKLVDALNEDNGPDGPFAAATGRSAVTRVGTSPQDRIPGEFAINIRHTLPEAPGALAFHFVTNGVPDIEVGWDLFDGVLDGADPFSVGVDHEQKETLRNPGANGWKDSVLGNGRMSADEACDKVQNTFREGCNGVKLSNYLLEAAFIPGAPGPWDALGVMTSQDDLTNGYDIEADAPTNVSQVTPQKLGFAASIRKDGRVVHMRGGEKLTEKQKKRKTGHWSRAHRMGIIG